MPKSPISTWNLTRDTRPTDLAMHFQLFLHTIIWIRIFNTKDKNIQYKVNLFIFSLLFGPILQRVKSEKFQACPSDQCPVLWHHLSPHCLIPCHQELFCFPVPRWHFYFYNALSGGCNMLADWHGIKVS